MAKKSKKSDKTKDASYEYEAINDTSKTYEEVDPDEVGRALGVEHSISSLMVEANGREYFEIRRSSDGQVRKIYSISDDYRTRDYKLLCETRGQFFFDCLYMARHTPDFYDRVVAYRISSKHNRPDNMKWRVLFYEEKPTA